MWQKMLEKAAGGITQIKDHLKTLAPAPEKKVAHVDKELKGQRDVGPPEAPVATATSSIPGTTSKVAAARSAPVAAEDASAKGPLSTTMTFEEIFFLPDPNNEEQALGVESSEGVALDIPRLVGLQKIIENYLWSQFLVHYRG